MPRKTKQPAPRRQADRRSGAGTPADRLIRAWIDQDDEAFAELAEELIAGGRDGVLATAIRKLSDRYEPDAVEEFGLALTEIGEMADGAPAFDIAELVLLPVVAAQALPDPGPLASGLLGSGGFPPEAEMRFLADWYAAEAIGGLSPAALRRLLLDLVAGRPPADLPVLAGDAASQGTVAVLLGAAIFRDAPTAEELESESEALLEREAEAADARAEAFETWRDALPPELTGGALILSPCAPSELADQIHELLDGAGPDIEEILDFVEAAREEAGGAEIVARLAAGGEGVELTVLTRAGRTLDSRVFGEAEDGLTVEDLREALDGHIEILDDEA
ncbi:MAG: hypothetical protein ACOYOH_00775 [Paracraurococcus sp.]